LLGGLAGAQLFLRVPQQERPAVTVGHRIHLTAGQFLQALLGLVQRCDERGNVVTRVRQGR
jgi:hypothetical protein